MQSPVINGKSPPEIGEKLPLGNAAAACKTLVLLGTTFHAAK
jgi:hypothetical protein